MNNGERTMAKNRKTVTVEWLRDHANRLLEFKGYTQEQKAGIAFLLSDVLLATDNYNGFMLADPGDKSREFDRHYIG